MDIAEIMHAQKLLFDGFLRIEILNTLSNETRKIASNDVINLCHAFFKLEIKSLMDQHSEILTKDGANEWLEAPMFETEAKIHILRDLCDKLCETQEFWIAYKIIKMIISFKDLAMYNNQLGLILSSSGSFCAKTDEIQKAYQRAIELDPTQPVYRYNYGECLRDADKFESAMEQFKIAMDLDAKDPDYPRKCGDCYKGMKDYDKAKEYYLKSIELETNNVSKSRAYAGFAYFFVYIVCKDIDAARRYFEKAIELDPKNGDAYFQCARMLRSNGPEFFKEAEKYYLKAMEIIDVKESKINASYAYLLHIMGNDEKARKYIGIQMELDEVYMTHWTWFYYGLIVEEMEDAALLKAVDLVTRKSFDITLIQLNNMRERATLKIEYYDRFETMLNSKFEIKV